MAKNPKWHKDVNDGGGSPEETDEETPASTQPVDPDALNHEQLDAIAAERQVVWERGDLTKAEKAKILNGEDLV